MQVTILPKAPLGKWSVGLAAAFILLVVLGWGLFELGGVELGPVGPAIVGVACVISGIAALVTGLISTIKSKERSILVFLAMLIGLFVLLFLLGEILGSE